MLYLIKSMCLFTLILLSLSSHAKANEPTLIYEEEFNDKPCAHCPKYINLTNEVNKIVEKVKESDSISESNEQLIQLNKLKFLYYVVRSESDTGEITCTTKGDKNRLRHPKLDGHFKTITESLMNISAVTDVQFIPKGKEEVFYYYRGDGANSNVIIEVKMNRDGTSRMRYFDYETREDLINKSLPDISETPFPNDPYIKLGVDLKNKNDPSREINALTVGTQIKLADNLNVAANNKLNNDQQSASISLNNNGGNKIASISGTNTSSGKKSLNAILPMEITINEESELKVKGSFQQEYSTSGSGNNAVVQSRRTLKLGLSDKNNEYFNVNADSDNNGVQGVGVSAKYKIGEKNSIAAGYRQVNDGTKSFNIDTITQLSDHKTLTTSFEDTSDKKFIKTQLEKKIDDTTTMAVSVKTDMNEDTVVMYQFNSVY